MSRKQAQKSNAVRLEQLEQYMMERNTEFLFYFGAIADILADKFPEKFRGADGKPIDFYSAFIKRHVKQEDDGKNITIEGPPRAQ